MLGRSVNYFFFHVIEINFIILIPIKFMVTCEYHRNMFWSVIYSVQISLQCTNKFSLSCVEWQTKREILNQLSSVSVIIYGII